jgi:hypothetical protein
VVKTKNLKFFGLLLNILSIYPLHKSVQIEHFLGQEMQPLRGLNQEGQGTSVCVGSPRP